MIEIICDGYDESEFKRNRRKYIIKELVDCLVETGITNFTFTKAYEYLHMEKKSLYRYYPNVNMIIIECALVLQDRWAVEIDLYIKDKLAEAARSNASALQCLKDVLISLTAASIENAKTKVFRFINDFENYINDLQDELAIAHYEKLKGKLREAHQLSKLLEYAIEKGETSISADEAFKYSNICYQSVVAYSSRYLKKKHDNSYYIPENLYEHIEMLIFYLKKRT